MQIPDEFSGDKFLKAIEAHMLVGDGPVDPPREIRVAINIRSVRGEAQLRVFELFSRLNESDIAEVTFAFSESTVAFFEPLSLRLTPYEGSIRITAPISPAGNEEATIVALDFPAASASLFSSPPGSPAVFQQYLADALTAFIRALDWREFFRPPALIPSGDHAR
jgi:hypothetical protein